MKRKTKQVFKLILLIFATLVFCEYLIYYIVISQCSWPLMKEEHVDESIKVEPFNKGVKALFIADVHLMGLIRGHWLDKLRREWQMYQSFKAAVTLLQPEVVFILGDIFDHGMRCSDYEFSYYVDKLNSIFKVPDEVKIYYIAGNHDIGFHYDITPLTYARFVTELNSHLVQLVTIRGNHFILINSMAMEGDGCFICRPAQVELNKIAHNLRCAKGIKKCPRKNSIKKYSRPILLQHFPMYRDSDRQCSEPDQAPEDIKKQEFQERRDCLSREASEMIYDNLNPRVIVGGHTHHGCHVVHREDIHEYTVPSFNWRNKNNPSFLLGIFEPNNYAVSKCYLPQETTVIFLYFLCCFFIVLWVVLSFSPKGIHMYKLHKKFY